MAVLGNEAVRIAASLLGTPYHELDCINLIKYIIRKGPGGIPRYTIAGTNALWNSQTAIAKYRDITACREIGNGSALAGELAVIRESGDCSHVGICTGGREVIHASKSRGQVVRTPLTARGGWTHILTHRYITPEEVGADTPAAEQAGSEAPAGAAYIVCAEGGLRMRKTPGGEYMQMVPDGTRIMALGRRDGWIKTQYKGHTGWISGDYCCLADGND